MNYWKLTWHDKGSNTLILHSNHTKYNIEVRLVIFIRINFLTMGKHSNIESLE